MDMIKINYVGIHRLARFVKHPLKIFGAFHNPPRRFVGNIHAVAQSARQRFAYCNLALAAKVYIAGVDIVYAAFNGAAHHAHGLVHVNRFAVCQHRQAQHAKAQCRYINAGSAHGAVLHVGVVV